MLSAVVGMAGGITLLSVMLLFLEPLAALPLHGAIQLVSNGSRACIQRRHLHWDILARYAVLLVPFGFVGLFIARALPAGVTRVLIGLFVLVATWAPGRLMLGTHPERANPGRRFLLLGGAMGLLNMTVGATGPLIAPFFLNLGLGRQALVGTKAACQALGHAVKIGIFGVAGFAFGDHLEVLVLLSLLVVCGTWAGSRMLERVSERVFAHLYRGVLSLIALRLVLADAPRLLGLG
jgi:uncharacterized membrane protein YfcA